MQERFDDPRFLVQFPIWMLLNPTEPSRWLIKISGASGECGFPLFTDKGLAERFKAGIPPLAHYVLGAANDRAAFEPLLDRLKYTQGFTHVSIDPTDTQSRFVPLDMVCAAVQDQRATD